MATQQARKVYPKKPHWSLPLEELVQLRAKVESGTASLEESDLARRSLSAYRNKYLSGALSQRAAFRLGLIDAKGKELWLSK